MVLDVHESNIDEGMAQLSEELRFCGWVVGLGEVEAGDFSEVGPGCHSDEGVMSTACLGQKMSVAVNTNSRHTNSVLQLMRNCVNQDDMM